ncbi:hypothetical protein [Haloarcula sp. K1]|uniref:hypothetical protein n=1 Tax=Haloarcula sp. K1 TaxID=1622207 RepID=UPI0007BAF635|nr:hypothetical protein [Haloarcula sp. K1]KZX46210.1 hypothetical protein AV929_15670 [Haloarcula sp. K1]
MNALTKALDDILKPEFTRFNRGRKRPTKRSIERLTKEYGPPGEEDHHTVTYYLVEVELGYLRDLNANPPTYPAARITYLSEDGRLNQCVMKAVPNEDGKLEPKSGVKPVVVRPWMEGTAATEEQWQEYAPILHRAHGLSLSPNEE